jgi:hypothetical protein
MEHTGSGMHILKRNSEVPVFFAGKELIILKHSSYRTKIKLQLSPSSSMDISSNPLSSLD